MSYIYVKNYNVICVCNLSKRSLISMNNTENFITKNDSKIYQNNIMKNSSNSLVVNA
jgi:hypothetical protein